MGDLNSTAVFKANISGLKKAMQEASRQVRLASAEFKAATAGMESWGSSADGLEAKLKQLDTTLAAQNKQLELQKQELANTEVAYGKNSAAADRVRIAIYNQQAAIAKTESEIKKYKTALDGLNKAEETGAKDADKYASATDKLTSTIDKQESKLEELKKAYKDAQLDGNTDDAKAYASAIRDLSSRLAENKKKMSDADRAADELDASMEELDASTRAAGDGFTVLKGVISNLVTDGIRFAAREVTDLAKKTFEVGSSFESSMSKVQAVSGASADEVEALTDKAKEMGEKTIFSATESAEAFNYMAMAGWNTQDMLEGIEGVMNLAAASGTDLATTSDIVTDALTAMGYESKDAGRLADVIAEASAKANTNVEMMGNTFQYVAPVVGAFGYSMEDTAIAIGLMANNGIKANKAGTALRSILSRLSAPPKEASTAMEALGISITDDSGNMKDLMTVIKDLRESFNGLTGAEQAQYAKMLAGQEAMSGLLAIVNSSPSDFEDLTRSIYNSTGAAERMSEIMNDNVNGQLELLKANVEDKMIKVFEKASPAIKDSIKSISRSLNSLDWDSIGDGAGEVAKKFGEFVKYCIDNGPTIKNILTSIGTTMLTVFTVTKVADFTNSVKILGTTFIQLGTSLGVLTTSTNAAGAATLSFNAALLASPVTIAVGAVGALAAAMLYLKQKNDDAISAQYGLNDAQEKGIEKAAELASDYQEMADRRGELVENIDAEYGYLEKLVEEYNSLVGSNGRVKEGYEERADFIIGRLAEAMGVERDQIEETITKNGKLGDSIDRLIQKKQAEATLSATQDSYTEAIQKRQEALNTYVQNQQTYQEAEQKYQAILAESGDALGQYQTLLETAPESADKFYWANQNLIKGQQEAKASMESAQQGLKDAETAYVGYASTIENWERLSQATASGSSYAIGEALTKIQNDFITAETGTKTALENQLNTFKTNYENMKAAAESGMGSVTDSQVAEAKKLVDAAQKELDNLAKESKESAKKSGESFSNELGSQAAKAEQAGKKQASGAAKGQKAGARESKSAGKTAGENFATGVSSAKDKAQNAGKQDAQSAAVGARAGSSGMNAAGQYTAIQYVDGVKSKTGAASSAGSSLASNAKSGMEGHDTTYIGENFGAGFVNGINNYIQPAINKARELVQAAINAANAAQQSHSPSKVTYESGKWFTQGYINGIASMQSGLTKTVKNMVQSVIKIMSDMSNYDFDTVAQNASTAFADAFSSNSSYMIAKMTYQNEQKLKEFDSDISDWQKKSDANTKKLQAESNKKQKTLQKKIDAEKDTAKKKKLKNALKTEKANVKKQINASKESYQKLINQQTKAKEQYQNASAQWISEFTKAVNDYQSKAQNLIDSTINGITDKYNERYDELINKQDNLISKLKSAGDLFTISGAGIMTVNDIKEQTKAINDYTAKLQKIKSKVSADLFDQITSYDMTEGSAFLDRLLKMSTNDLKAYDKAYTEKMKAAQKAGEKIYKADFNKVASDYQKDINKAFKTIPDELEKLGKQSMQGFVKGLTKNTDYMQKEVKTFIKSMVDQFKSLLKIKSPSRVMFDIGEYTGEGFNDGLVSLLGTVKKTAKDFADAVATPIEGLDDKIIDMRGSVAQRGFYDGSVASQSVTNNYNLVQNNNSPKSLSALETYQARRRQIALVKAFA